AFVFFLFFSSRRRHTRSYGDWSSDVCSSDLGLGLEFTRQYLADGNTVIAACRSPDAAPGLAQLARRSKGTLSVVQVDVADTHSVRRSVTQVPSPTVDILVNCAGVTGASGQTIGSL